MWKQGFQGYQHLCNAFTTVLASIDEDRIVSIRYILFQGIPSK